MTGYKIARIKFENGRPVGNEYMDFLTGWLPNNWNSSIVYGRPVGVMVYTDGSLLISDDASRKIWRVSYSHDTVETSSPGISSTRCSTEKTTASAYALRDNSILCFMLLASCLMLSVL